jgi:tetratricopeptide (TPR) repeat protein
MDPVRVGDHEVVRTIGRGGMGSVYEVRDTRSGVARAAKVVSKPGDARARERFKREGELLARCDRHPGIVKVHSVGESSSGLYMILDLVRGEDLEAVVARGGRLEPRRAARIGLEVARALAFVHGQGVVHRDVKPSNVLIDESGRALLTDFGIATATDLERLTRTGMFVGTPGFVSPEQATGAPVGTPTDIFSLGCVLFHALAGEPPVSCDEVMPWLAALASSSRIRDVRSVAPSVPARLAAIVGRTLEKDPAKRYGTASELASDLESFLEGGKPAERRRSRVAIVVAVGLLIAGGLALVALRPETRSVAPDESAAAIERRGDAALAAGDFAGAESLFGRALRELPSVRVKRARAAALAGHETVSSADLAVLASDSRASRDPRLAPALYARGLAAADVAARERDLEAALKLEPPPPSLRLAVARSLHELARLGAEAWGRRVTGNLALTDDDVDALAPILRLAHRAHGLDPALPHDTFVSIYQLLDVYKDTESTKIERMAVRFLADWPDDPVWLAMLAHARQMRDEAQRADALSLYEKAIDVLVARRRDDPSVAPIAHMIAHELAYLSGRPSKLRAVDMERYEKDVFLSGDDPGDWYGLADAWRAAGDIGRARAALDRAIAFEARPGAHVGASVNVEVAILWAEGRRDEVLKKVEENARSGRSGSLGLEARYLCLAGHHEEVVALVDPKTTESWPLRWRARSLAALGRIEEARAIADHLASTSFPSDELAALGREIANAESATGR